MGCSRLVSVLAATLRSAVMPGHTLDEQLCFQQLGRTAGILALRIHSLVLLLFSWLLLQVPQAVDTNGAGDTFATAFMIALMRGDANPGHTAAWAASRAVMQPQTCKPRCAPRLITAAPGGLAPLSEAERVRIALRPLLQALAAAAEPVVQPLAARAAAALPTGTLVQPAWVKQLAQWLGVVSGSSSSSAAAAAGVPADTQAGS